MQQWDYNLDNYNFGKALIRIRQDWRDFLRYAWSVRLLLVAVLLTGIQTVLPLIGYRLPVSDIWLALINFVVASGAFMATFLVQSNFYPSYLKARHDPNADPQRPPG